MKKIWITLLIMVNMLFASIGEITALKGQATLLRDGSNQAIMIGTKLQERDEIQTDKNSKLQIVFVDKTVISLGQKSHFKVDEYLFADKKVAARFSVSKGFFKSITGKIGKISPKKFKIKTANATIGVRGTTIIAEVASKRDIIACSSGQIVVSSAQGSVVVDAGERTIVEEMKAPRQSQKVNSIILKKLESKSDTTVQEASSLKIEKTSDTKKKSEKEIKEEKQSVTKFDPWLEEKKPQTLTDIENVIGERRPTYQGKITQGSTSNGAIDSASSSVILGFDLGSGAMDGDIKFKDNADDYHIPVAGKIEGDSSFDFSAKNAFDGGGKGKLSGDKFEHANGEMHFREKMIGGDVNKIDATFETSRK